MRVRTVAPLAVALMIVAVLLAIQPARAAKGGKKPPPPIAVDVQVTEIDFTEACDGSGDVTITAWFINNSTSDAGFEEVTASVGGQAYRCEPCEPGSRAACDGLDFPNEPPGDTLDIVVQLGGDAGGAYNCNQVIPGFTFGTTATLPAGEDGTGSSSVLFAGLTADHDPGTYIFPLQLWKAGDYGWYQRVGAVLECGS